MKLFLLVLSFLFASCAKDQYPIASPFETDGEVYAFGFWPKCPEIKPFPKCPDQPTNPVDPDETMIELFNIMNDYRSKAGIAKLFLDSALTCAAVNHSNDIGPKGLCSHSGSDGSSPTDRAKRCGTSAFGEIVACGQRSPREAIEAWFNSQGHRNIMLNPQYSKVGMGMSNYYWTAIFK